MALTDDERNLLKDALQRFTIEAYDDKSRRTAMESALGFSRERWRSFADFGWLAIYISTDLGGIGGSFRDACLVMEYVGRSLIVEPLLESAIVGAWLIEQGSPCQWRKRWLEGIARGELLVALAHFESRGGFDREWVTTTFRKAADGFVLSGTKSPVHQGPSADLLIVSAMSQDDGGLALFGIDRETHGVHVHSARAVDGTPLAKITFDNVLVDESRRFESDNVSTLLDTALDRGALATCAKSVGAMSVALSATASYTKARCQFGRPLAAMQSVRHRLVDMHIALAEAAALTSAATEIMDDHDAGLSRAISAAKVRVISAGRFIGEQSIQLHGGMGMTDDLFIGHLYKSLLACAGQYGDSDWHLSRLAKQQ